MTLEIGDSDRATAGQLEEAFARFGAREASIERLVRDGRLDTDSRHISDGIPAALAFCFEVRSGQLASSIAADVANYSHSELAPTRQDCAQIIVSRSDRAWAGAWPAVWAEWTALCHRHPHVAADRERAMTAAATRIADALAGGTDLPVEQCEELAWSAIACAALPQGADRVSTAIRADALRHLLTAA